MYGRFVLLALFGTALAAPAAHARFRSVSVEREQGRLAVVWAADGPVDVYEAKEADASVNGAVLLSDDDRDGRHIVTAEAFARPYFLLKDESDGTILRVAERLLPLERGSNFRDLGGYRAADGRYVRWGRIFRSGAMPVLSDADIRYFAGLGIATVVDLRSAEERELAPDTILSQPGVRYFASDYSMASIFGRLMPAPGGNTAVPRQEASGMTLLYRDWLVSLAPQFREMFASLLAGEGGLVYHCSAGQDRTGVGSALILAALGVPREVILADYHLSTPSRRPEHEMPKIDPARFPNNAMAAYFAKASTAEVPKARPLYDARGVAFLAATFDEIDTRWGSVEHYLDDVLGIGAVELAELRADYLE